MLENHMVLYTPKEHDDAWGDDDVALDDDFDDSIDDEEE